MSDRVAVMSAGEVQQIGTPEEIYRQPANRFVAEFVGRVNLIAGTVAGCENSNRDRSTAARSAWARRPGRRGSAAHGRR